ncbi:vWA domain-containing protein [Halorhabdus sp. CUG00001]|uniref:vWA domain-containing protein n=1 Tax=Halorhabdus sp. CUG00001 TaxID=2600297 RepID=UPI00131B6E7A|nr:vWA domain-containing protein [Halorhabdus sp. CUG00001]
MSELLGYVLLVGIVMTGAVAIVIFGASAIGGLQEQQDAEATQTMMQEVDSRLATLSTASESRAVGFSFAETDQTVQRSPDLVQDQGYVNVTVNGNATCSANISLDSIRLENEAGAVIVYEAGGVWRLSEDGAASIVTPPTVSIQDGQVSLSLTNMTGSVAAEDNQAILNATSSAADSTAAMNKLLQGSCMRPDNVTVQVQSDMYQAWGEHLAGETGLDVRPSPPAGNGSYLVVDDSTETATVYLNQSALPERTNDAENNVVDVTGASYMDDVMVTSDGISVSKDANNTYTVYAEPVADDIEIGSVQRIAQADNVTRPPLDVVFVVDESGSMGDDGPSGQEKRESVKGSARNFITYLDSDMDRVGLVGFQEVPDVYDEDNPSSTGRFPYPHPNFGRIYRTNDLMLTSDFSAFNDTSGGTLERLQAEGWTYSAGGMKKAYSLLDLKSNENRNRIIVLLSDGKNKHNHYEDWWVSGTKYESYRSYFYNGHLYDGDEAGTDAATIKVAQLASNSGITSYTVGFGNSAKIDEDLLSDVAKAGTGKYYYAKNASALEEAFSSIAERVSSTKQVGRLPMSTNLSANGSTHPPQITGDVTRIANVTQGGETFLNVNDPFAPSTFSHAFTVSDGEMVNFSATVYGCDRWVATSQTETINGSQYPVTRCAAMNKSDGTTVEDNNVSVYTNDDSAAFTSDLSGWETAEWQTNLTDALNESNLYNTTTDQLNLESNQVLVAYDFPQQSGSETDNIMLMRYTIGLSEENARPSGIIDVDINNVRIES